MRFLQAPLQLVCMAAVQGSGDGGFLLGALLIPADFCSLPEVVFTYNTLGFFRSFDFSNCLEKCLEVTHNHLRVSSQQAVVLSPLSPRIKCGVTKSSGQTLGWGI